MRLHITNGDSAAGTLRQAVEGTVATWSDVLHEGPVPALPADRLADVRATYLASRGYASLDRARALLQRQSDVLDAAGQHAEVVLWFEHDLFDQLLLIQLLDRLAPLSQGPGEITLVCIGEFPGIERFVGLGQLSAEQLRSLAPMRAPVTPEQFSAAREAWAAFTATTPGALERLAMSGVRELPFLGDALRRLLAEYPSAHNGTGMVDRLALERLALENATGRALFQVVSDREERPFLGDTPFYAALRDLGSARYPLIAPEGRAGTTPPPAGDELEAVALTRFGLTGFGREVLAGRKDAARVNGIDRWIGGVHLEGHDPRWRWDVKRGRLRRAT